MKFLKKLRFVVTILFVTTFGTSLWAATDSTLTFNSADVIVAAYAIATPTKEKK